MSALSCLAVIPPRPVEIPFSELEKCATKYDPSMGSDVDLVHVTFLGDNRVRICKTDTPEIRSTRHTKEAKAIWAWNPKKVEVHEFAKVSKVDGKFVVTLVATPSPTEHNLAAETLQGMQAEKSEAKEKDDDEVTNYVSPFPRPSYG